MKRFLECFKYLANVSSLPLWPQNTQYFAGNLSNVNSISNFLEDILICVQRFETFMSQALYSFVRIIIIIIIINK